MSGSGEEEDPCSEVGGQQMVQRVLDLKLDGEHPGRVGLQMAGSSLSDDGFPEPLRMTLIRKEILKAHIILGEYVVSAFTS